MSARRPHIDHGLRSRALAYDKPLSHKGVAPGSVMVPRLAAMSSGQILYTGNVHDMRWHRPESG